MMGGPNAFAGKRVLDVGCAKGGIVVAASKAGRARWWASMSTRSGFETAP